MELRAAAVAATLLCRLPRVFLVRLTQRLSKPLFWQEMQALGAG